MQIVAPKDNRRARSPKILSAQRSGVSRTFLTSDQFEATLRLERRRAERSGRQFVLMLADMTKPSSAQAESSALEIVTSTIAVCTRETDVMGLYVDETRVG